MIDSEAVGQTQIDQNGIWSLTTQLDQPGEIEVQVQIIDAEGQLIVATEPITVTVTAASGQ
ncbi:MAG: hypothetical protein ACPGWR_07015 [Ardenticatenaceae bacterium]